MCPLKQNNLVKTALNLLVYNLIFIIQLKIVALRNTLRKEPLHFVLIKAYTAIIAVLIITYIVSTHFTPVSHYSHLPLIRTHTYRMKKEHIPQAD